MPMFELSIGTISEKGKKEIQEDAIFQDGHQLFMVCDGVGGHAKGEIASSLAISGMHAFLTANRTALNQSPKACLDAAIAYTETEFDKYIAAHPESRDMATTLTFLLFQDDIVIGHIGDSRVYHVRNGNILFRTTDHSYVNELVASGYITEEQALTHPKKNVITRAIQGTEAPSPVDLDFVEDVRPCDYFILCTDGILEGATEDFIADMLPETDLASIVDSIRQRCYQHSIDNYSGIFIKVGRRLKGPFGGNRVFSHMRNRLAEIAEKIENYFSR